MEVLIILFLIIGSSLSIYGVGMVCKSEYTGWKERRKLKEDHVPVHVCEPDAGDGIDTCPWCKDGFVIVKDKLYPGLCPVCNGNMTIQVKEEVNR